MTNAPAESQPTAIERTLAYLILAVVLLSLACFAVIVVRGVAGANMADAPWPVVALFPAFGLPIGFVFVITLLVMGAVRRSRAAKDAGH